MARIGTLDPARPQFPLASESPEPNRSNSAPFERGGPPISARRPPISISADGPPHFAKPATSPPQPCLRWGGAPLGGATRTYLLCPAKNARRAPHYVAREGSASVIRVGLTSHSCRKFERPKHNNPISPACGSATAIVRGKSARVPCRAAREGSLARHLQSLWNLHPPAVSRFQTLLAPESPISFRRKPPP
jgi:hypothetical protein